MERAMFVSVGAIGGFMLGVVVMLVVADDPVPEVAVAAAESPAKIAPAGPPEVEAVEPPEAAEPEKSTEPQPVETPTTVTPIEVSAARLISDFANNEIAAENKYVGKLLIVTGKVHSVGRAMFGEPYVVLDDGSDSIDLVQCLFDDSGGLESISEGDTVSITGECTSKTLTNVMLRGCVVE